MAEGEMTVAAFRKTVWAHYKKSGRHDLPWRAASPKAAKFGKDDLLYRTLVSEMMLQQTQVERVIPFYKDFIKRFPTAKKLAAAPLSEVLRAWQGLGYNRRAKMLHAAAKELAAGTTRFNLKSESSRLNLVVRLGALPGVGPYTARAIATFAFNQDVIVIETNIRTAVIHHFFSNKNVKHQVSDKKISDAEILEILSQALPKGRAREWYSALMDYGAHLKRSGISHNARSKTYTKQSKFIGSLREARGAILRALAQKSQQGETLLNLLGLSRRAQMCAALKALQSEGLIKKKGSRFALAD